MPDSVIVTIIYNQTAKDFSLPFDTPIKSWIEGLQTALLSPALQLIHNDHLLDPQYSLKQYNIWDGATLTASPAK